jgi:glycosyltransferase involved in cell wall biosynthesis
MAVARTLRMAGHTMWLNASGAASDLTYDVKIDPQIARDSWGEDIGFYEGDSIFSDPPDVIIVGSEIIEEPAMRLWEKLNAIKPVVMCAFSGCYQSKFTWSLYRGAMCADEPSRSLCRYYDVPVIRYYELLDPNAYPYTQWREPETIILPTFVNNFRDRFPTSASFHDECSEKIAGRFGDKVKLEVVDGKPHHEVMDILRRSPAVLMIKDQEGYGWSVIEALATGRPIIYQAGLMRGMEFHKWTEPGVTAIPFVTAEDLISVIDNMLADREKLASMQSRSSAVFREKWDGLATSDDFNLFLEDLVRLEHARWMPNRPLRHERRDVAHYAPTLDPAFRQDWETALGVEPNGA